MARRKVFHSDKISYIDKRFISLSTVDEGDMVEFKYKGDNIFDNKPVVFIFEKQNTFIKGININYLTEYRVQQLLQEVNLKKMKWYELYDDSIRTYKKNKITSVRRITYKRDIDAT